MFGNPRNHDPAGIELDQRRVFATFQHRTSRAQDPQLHTHAVLVNLALRKDGTTGSLLSRPFFDQKLALGALEAGAEAVRLNPGNLGGAEKTRPVVEACRERGASLRLGVNAGSLEADLLAQYGAPTAPALAASAAASCCHSCPKVWLPKWSWSSATPCWWAMGRTVA